MKYGLIVYFNTDNIGDDILSYAAEQFLPRVDYIIDRENLDIFVPDAQEQVAVIMNGWYLHHKSHWPPSEYLYPLLLGIHFSNNQFEGIVDEHLDGLGREFLEKFQPVGCRDSSTLVKMEQRQVEAYFSGCLTMTIKQFPNVEHTGRYILVDVPKAVSDKVIFEKGSENVEIITHYTTEEYISSDWAERKSRIEELLKKYQGAELVITTRLHCLLPCMALQTKAILLTEQNADTLERMGDYIKMANHCTIDDFINGNYNWQDISSNPDMYIMYRNDLAKRCNEFVSKCEDPEKWPIVEKQLPQIDESQLKWKERIEWQRNLDTGKSISISTDVWNENQNALAWQKDQIFNKDMRIRELEQDIQEIEAGKKWLTGQLETKEKRIKELEKAASELQNSKEWIENQLKCKDERIAELEKSTLELQTGKEWIESQLNDGNKQIQEMEDWVKELEKANDWHVQHEKEMELYIQKLKEEK